MDARVPGPGEWRARVWLGDAAGNLGAESYAETVLRLDDQPPALVLLAPSSDRPAFIRIKASDSSGLATEEILIRRQGTATWSNLPVKAERGGFSTMLDDEALPDGGYEIRARAVDVAGNERSTERGADGKRLILALPLRIRTSLAVGRRKRMRARGGPGRLRYRIKLIRAPRAHFGHSLRLHGRLTSPGGHPLAGRRGTSVRTNQIAGRRLEVAGVGADERQGPVHIQGAAWTQPHPSVPLRGLRDEARTHSRRTTPRPCRELDGGEPWTGRQW